MIHGCHPLNIMRHDDGRGWLSVITSSAFGLWREAFCSSSHADVLRGMHWQEHQDKLVICQAGMVLDVILDMRRNSITYGMHTFQRLFPGDGLYVADGVAHGFYAYEPCVMLYLTTTVHDASLEHGVRWDSCGIPWRDYGLFADPIVSARDQALPAL